MAMMLNPVKSDGCTYLVPYSGLYADWQYVTAEESCLILATRASLLGKELIDRVYLISKALIVFYPLFYQWSHNSFLNEFASKYDSYCRPYHGSVHSGSLLGQASDVHLPCPFLLMLEIMLILIYALGIDKLQLLLETIFCISLNGESLPRSILLEVIYPWEQ